MPQGVVFAVAGAKGGVGRTTTSINLSAVLAEIGHSVLLVEADIAMANVGDFLDLGVRLEHGRDPTLHDVLAGAADVEAATYEAPGGFDVMPSGVTLDGFANADIDRTSDVVEAARSEYGVVVIDTGAGLGAETLRPLSLADETILVSSPRVAAVRDTKKTRDLVRHVDGSVAGVCFVGSGSGRSPAVDRIAEYLSVDLLGHIPEDTAVVDAQDVGEPVVVAARDSDAARAYGALGARIHDRVGALRTAQTEEAAADEEAAEGEATGRPGDRPTGEESTEELSFVRGPNGDVKRVLRQDAEAGSEADSESAAGETADVASGDTAGNTGSGPDGATDDEIARRLARVESGVRESVAADESDAETAAVRDEDSWESKQSAAKGFIDRALKEVDRESD